MFRPTRRDVVVSAAAGAAFGLSGPLRFLPSALADEARQAGFFNYQIGEIACTAFYDGVWQKEHDENFIRNATVEQTKEALAAGGLTTDHVPIEFTQTVLKTGGKTVLIDAGTGGQLAPTAGLMMTNMAAAGFDPASIDIVLISHFHPDHIFGLMAKDTNEQIFPEAEIIVPEVEYAFWTDPGVFSQLPENWHGLATRIQATFPNWSNITRAAGEQDVAPGIRSLPAFGHTVGHTAFHVSSGDAELLMLGDSAIVPALFVAHPDWHVAFDADPDLAEANRRTVFDRAIADGATISGYHFGFPNAGTMAKDGNGYVFEPLA